MTRLTLRFDFETGFRLGPGKVRLLEHIEQAGSISAAARALGMSYRRAWLLVESMNRAFARPLVATSPGGRSGGGAEVTAAGRRVIVTYRSIEASARAAVGRKLAKLERTLRHTA